MSRGTNEGVGKCQIGARLGPSLQKRRLGRKQREEIIISQWYKADGSMGPALPLSPLRSLLRDCDTPASSFIIHSASLIGPDAVFIESRTECPRRHSARPPYLSTLLYLPFLSSIVFISASAYKIDTAPLGKLRGVLCSTAAAWKLRTYAAWLLNYQRIRVSNQRALL